MPDQWILDTCALIWLATDDRRLSARAREEIEAAKLVHVSAISAWEISLKTARGTIELPLPPETWFKRVLEQHRLKLADLTVDVLTHANTLPWHHRDPADRFIIATASLNRFGIVTDDRRFGAYDIVTLS